MASDALRRDQLLYSARQLEGDDLAVLCRIADRLLMGKDVYGTMRINLDPRNFVKEAEEEMLDGAIYLAAELLRKERGRNDKR